MRRRPPLFVIGNDAIDALVQTLWMVKSLIDADGGVFPFGRSRKAGFPL